MDVNFLDRKAKVALQLEGLYSSSGYEKYTMNRFESYAFYMENERFLDDNRVITLQGANGKLLALKPDVTMSIVKNYNLLGKNKVYYNETVFKVPQGEDEFREIHQVGVEYIGHIDIEQTVEVLHLAIQSLQAISDDYTLCISHVGVVQQILDKLGLEITEKQIVINYLRGKNMHDLKLYLDDLGKPSDELLKLTNISHNVEIDSLDEVIKKLSDVTDCSKVCIDFSHISNTEYYNDLVFTGYVKGLATSVISGGRYDNLLDKMGINAKSALGFAVNLSEINKLNENEVMPVQDTDMIDIALPKGRLGDKVYKLFKDKGYSADEFEDNTRKLVFEDKENGVRFFLIKPSDVAVYVERGIADIGIVGRDSLIESGADVYELLDLGMGKCSMCVCSPVDYVDDGKKPLNVATKYSNIAKEYYQNRNIDIIKLNGSIELAPLLGLSHVIVDIVETGSTLRENNLKVDTKIMDLSARVIASKSRYNFNKDKINKLVEVIKND
ncbi:MAG: ATP phosphoribosyltransferase [Epulopiscium sp. Nele67-Bin004]|nr:MAG: ATP phosphoribosyltransferase [Epulopiscium sp. Nele67-Bin004]